MKYLTGEEIRTNDCVIADDSEGVVVCVFDTEQFSDEYPEGWGNLKDGVLVETKKWGLIHYPLADEDLKLIKHQPKDNAEE